MRRRSPALVIDLVAVRRRSPVLVIDLVAVRRGSPALVIDLVAVRIHLDYIKNVPRKVLSYLFILNVFRFKYPICDIIIKRVCIN